MNFLCKDQKVKMDLRKKALDRRPLFLELHAKQIVSMRVCFFQHKAKAITENEAVNCNYFVA